MINASPRYAWYSVFTSSDSIIFTHLWIWYLARLPKDREFAGFCSFLFFILRPTVIFLTHPKEILFARAHVPRWHRTLFVVLHYQVEVNGWVKENMSQGDQEERPLFQFGFLSLLGNLSLWFMLCDRYTLHNCYCLFVWSHWFILTPKVALCFEYRIKKKTKEIYSVSSLTIFLLWCTRVSSHLQ